MSHGSIIVNQPGVFLVDEDGNIISLADGVSIGSAKGVLIMGKDGSDARMMAVDSSGNLAALPLPAGAATEATLLMRATSANQTNGSQQTQVVDGVNVLDVNVSGQAAIQNPPNLDVAASTLAKESTLDSIKDTDGIKKITDPLPTGANLVGKVQLRNPGDTVDLGDATNPVRTDPTGTTTQPVSDGGGSLTVDGPLTDTELRAAAVPVSVAALPLPAGAATEATLATRSTEITLAAADAKLATIDSVLDSIKDTDGVKKITDALPTGANVLGKVQLRNPGDTVDLGDATNPVRVDPTGITTQPISDGGGSITVDGPLTDTELRATAVPVSAASLPLPAGAATEATLATRASAATQTDGSQKTQIVDGANILDVNASGQAAIQNPPNLDAAASTLATEATLATRASEATLASIKDTDGIKKITDALPVGDNIIGRIIQTDAQNKGVTDDIVGVEFSKQGVAAVGPTYFCIIDLDNTNGGYKHVASGSIQLAAFSGVIDKSSSGAQWNAKLGVILAINGSDVTIGFLAAGSIIADNTSAFVSVRSRNLFPLTINLEVSSGDFVDFATNNKTTNAELTTASVIEDITGGTVNPAVGDVVARLARTSGGGTANFAYTAQYRTVA